MPNRSADADRLRVRVEVERAGGNVGEGGGERGSTGEGGSVVAVLHLVGDLDFRTAPTLRRVVDARLAAGQVNLVFDCTELVFCDSSGLGVLVGAAKRTGARGGRVGLRAVPEHIRQVLMLTGLAKVLPIEPADEDPGSTGTTRPDLPTENG